MKTGTTTHCSALFMKLQAIQQFVDVWHARPKKKHVVNQHELTRALLRMKMLMAKYACLHEPSAIKHV